MDFSSNLKCTNFLAEAGAANQGKKISAELDMLSYI